MRCGAFVLSEREDDGKRVCRTVWGCPEGHVWWLWADRPEGPPEPCPDPGLMGE
ncbi:dehydrogenase [Streptomyces zhihengii]